MLERRIADPGVGAATQNAAIGVTVMLIAASVAAMRLSAVPGPANHAFIPIVATVWAVGDLLTGFLLYAHYRVTGRVAFLAIGGAYLACGLLTIPYIAAFPSMFFSDPSLVQVSLALWLCWHTVFPLAVAVYVWIDPQFTSRIVDRQSIERFGVAVTSAIAVSCAALSFGIFAIRNALPALIRDGHFAPAYSQVAAPFVATLSLVAIGVVFVRVRRPSALHVWLTVAMLTMALDAMLNAASVARYGVAWYVGKIETVLTATLLLAVLLQEIATMYEQVTTQATTDGLTGLRNRRSFDEAAAWMLGLCKRRGWSIAVLMIDIDHFKRFNDELGHASGDQCLKGVAAALRGELMRSSDLIARFGGEEFVVLLVDLDRESAALVAERLIQAVRARPISCGAFGNRFVTISAGMAWTTDVAGLERVEQLQALADDALYESKRSGRDRFTVSDEISSILAT